MQNLIIKGRDNPVIFNFNLSGDFAAEQLNGFTRLVINITNSDGASESYSTDEDPDQLFIFSPGQLRLSIGDTTELSVGLYAVEIIGYSATYDDGYELSGKNRPIFGKIKVV